MAKIVIPYPVYTWNHQIMFREQLTHKGWTGLRAWACAYTDRWIVAPRLYDVWPEKCPSYTTPSKAYMRCIALRFEPIGCSGTPANELTTAQISPSADFPGTGEGDLPENCVVIAEYSSREIDEDRITFSSKVDALEVGMGRTWNGTAGGRLEAKQHILFPYEEFRVTKSLRSLNAQNIIEADMKNRVGNVNAAAFTVGSFTWPAQTVLFFGIDGDTWEVSNEHGLSYAHLDLLFRTQYVFGIRLGPTNVTWNMTWRPRHYGIFESNHPKRDANGVLQWDAQAGEWNNTTPLFYETADFTKMWTVG